MSVSAWNRLLYNCFVFGHLAFYFGDALTLHNNIEQATCNLHSSFSSECDISFTCSGRTSETSIMSLTARFVRNMFVTVRIFLIFIMTTTTHTLLRKLRMINVEMKAMNATSLSDKLIMSFVMISQIHVCLSVMVPLYPSVSTTVIGLK